MPATAGPGTRRRAALAGAAAAMVWAVDKVRRRTRLPARPLALGLALLEHTALFPLGYVVDRRHPARGEAGVAPMLSVRGFAQETFRHALFGVVLGRLAR